MRRRAAGDMVFVVVSSICGYLLSHHWLYTYIITLYLLSFISSLISIPYHRYSIHSIHLKDFPRPPPACSSSSAGLMLIPRPRAWEERATMMIAWLAWMIGADGGCDVRSAHSPCGSFAARQ